MKKILKIMVALFMIVSLTCPSYDTNCNAASNSVVSMTINGVTYDNSEGYVDIAWEWSKWNPSVQSIGLENGTIIDGNSLKILITVNTEVGEKEVKRTYKIGIKKGAPRIVFKKKFVMTTSLKNWNDHDGVVKGEEPEPSGLVKYDWWSPFLDGYTNTLGYDYQAEDDLRILLHNDIKNKNDIKFKSLTPQLFKVKNNRKLVFSKNAAGCGKLQVTGNGTSEIVKIVSIDTMYECKFQTLKKIGKNSLKLKVKCPSKIINGKDNLVWKITVKNVKSRKKTVKYAKFNNGNINLKNLPKKCKITISLNWKEKDKLMITNMGMTSLNFGNRMTKMKKNKNYSLKKFMRL